MNLNTMNEIEIQRLHENEQEEKNFKDNLHRLLNGNRQLASRPLVIGKTPYALSICGANGELPLMITKKVIDKCMRPEIRDSNGKRLKNSGHFLEENQLAAALASIKEPVMVLKGSLDNTFVAITDLKDNQDKEIIIAVEIDKIGDVGKINSISSVYGKINFSTYIQTNIQKNNVLAINIEKADRLLLSIGVDFPEANTFISFDNSIAYTTENVNYSNAKKSNEKEKDDMAAKKNSFNDFQQRDYDFAALEEKLLAKGEDAIKRADEAYREQAPVNGADGYRVFRETHEEEQDQLPHGEEKELSKQEQLQQLLEDGVKSVMDSDSFANWCETQGRFFSNHYSFRNSMLVYAQNPEATYVCGYEQWKDFGRQVKKGAKAIKIYSPVMASNGKGNLYSYIRRQCNEQLKDDPTKEYASYRVGRYDFIMYKNGRLFDVKDNKTTKTIGSNWTADFTKKFVDQYVVGKEPLYYNVQNVFDVKDTVVTDTLYVPKYKATAEEMILNNEDGRPIINARGYVKIKNTEERQARFNVNMDPGLIENDPAKMAILYDVVRQISENKNIPFNEVARNSDSVLAQGANGYFRLGSNGEPGSITISSDLTPTQKIRTSFHEMAHSDLHQDLSKLAEEIGADKPEITRQMKEVQAEAVAFMTANAFGIQTDHKSFAYIAQWSDGRELQALEKSLSVIYKESQRLLGVIEKELDNRGLDMNLNVKDQTPLSHEEKLPFIAKSKEFVLNARQDNDDMVHSAAEMLSLADERTQGIIKEQIVIMKQIDEMLAQMNKNIEQYETAETRQQQTELNYIIKSNRTQTEILQKQLDNLSEQMITAVKEDVRNEIKDLYATDPEKAILALQKEMPGMENLNKMDIKYLATSKFINEKYGRLVGVDNEKFVTLSLAQLENLKKVMSKNQTAVEIGWCEQWGENPIFTNGEVLHPAEANRVLANAEKQVQELRKQAEKKEDYYPYSKCNLTIYSVTEKGKLAALNTRIDIGDGDQKDIADHLDQIVKRGKERMDIVDHFKQSLKEKPRTKSMLPQVEEKTTSVSEQEHTTISSGKDNGTLDQTKWEQAMSNVSASIDNQEKSQEQESEKEQEQA